MMAETTKYNWTHKDNLAVYEEVSLGFFEEFAKQAGLDDHCDLKQIDQYIKSAGSILEVGGGSGRVLDYFKKINYAGEVTAVEWSKPLYDHLQNNYGDSVDIVHTDIMDYHPEKKFDLIVWMWGGINDFSLSEHKRTLFHLYSLLSDNGIVAFDTVESRKELPSSTRVSGNNYKLSCKKGSELTRSSLYFYFLSQSKIIKDIKAFCSKYVPSYFTTKTKVNRLIHLMMK